MTEFSADRPFRRRPRRSRSLGGFFLILLLLCVNCGLRFDESRQAEQGVVDIGSFDFHNREPLALEGEWEIYRGRLYSFEDFRDPAKQKLMEGERRYLRLPASLENLHESGEGVIDGMPSAGYATLRLRLASTEALRRDLKFYTRQRGLAFRLYCGDELLFSNGRLGTDVDSSHPGRVPVSRRAGVECYEHPELIWQVSNFHVQRGGPRFPILVAPASKMDALIFRQDLIAYVLIGVTVIITVYHIVLWTYRRHDRKHLRFGLLAVVVLVWTVCDSSIPQRVLGADDLYLQVLKLQLLALYFLPPAVYAFLQSCYVQEFPPKPIPVMLVIASFFALHNLLRPTYEVTTLLPYYFALVVVVLLYCMGATAVASARRKQGALAMLLSCMMASAGIGNDILVYLGFYVAPSLVPHGFFMFILVQSAVLAGFFTEAYRTADDLSRNLQIEVSEKIGELRSANDKLRELDGQRTTFFQNISHEFRTPLTLIKSPVEAAERRNELISRETQQVVLSNARRLQRLVDQLLDLQKIVAGKMMPRRRPISLAEFATLVTSSFEPYARIRGIELETVVSGDLPVVSVDPEMLDKCIFNYLSNALKFTNRGGRIVLRVFPDDGGAVVEVEDTGVGIPPERLGGLFQRYGYSGQALTQDQGGTGLGLSLVKELVELHGGRVGVTSVVDEGSRFRFWLPAAPEGSVPDHIERESFGHDIALTNADIEPQVPAVSSSPRTNRGRGRRILVVEDNVDLRHYMADIFDRQGYRVGEAGDGQEALDGLEAFRPDLIITDLMLPRVSGLDMITQIRSRSDYRTTPILLVTARADDQTKQEAHQAGADAYLAKPFDEAEILAIMRNLLSLKAREKELELDLAQARRIQENLLPSTLPNAEGLVLAALYRPMDKVGGDIYDFITLPDGSMGFFVGDVSGHGIPAALLASAVKMTLQAFGTRTSSPAELLRYMNQSLYGRTADNFLSCSCGFVTPKRDRLIYSMGGHPPALLIRDGEVRWHEAQGTWLGITPEVSFEEAEISVQPGDRIILYTDGIIEAMNVQEEMFGEDRFAECSLSHRKRPLKGQLEGIVEDVLTFQGTGSVQDDITLIGLEIL